MRSHMTRFWKMCAAVMTLACAVFLAAGGSASAALFDGDIGEERFPSVDESGLTYFILKRYVPPANIAAGGGYVVVPRDYPQGTYEIVCDAQPTYNTTFDYNGNTGVFTVYDGQGPDYRAQFIENNMGVRVEQLHPENRGRSGDYMFDMASERYISGNGGSLRTYVVMGLMFFQANYALQSQGMINSAQVFDGSYFARGINNSGAQFEFSIRKNPSRASAPGSAPQVKAPVRARYMVVNEYDDTTWVAFSYDPDTKTFTMYRPETANGEEPYSYRHFLPDGRLEVKNVGGGAHSGIYTENINGDYECEGEKILRYVTDGMYVFLQKIR